MNEPDTEAARNAMLQRLPGSEPPARVEEKAVTDEEAAKALDFIKDTPITPVLSGAERVRRMRAETQYGAFRKVIGAKFIAGKLGMNYEEIEMMKQKILGVASHDAATPEQVIAAGETLCRLIQTQLGVVEKDHKMLEEIPIQGGDRKSTRLNSSHPSISYAVF